MKKNKILVTILGTCLLALGGLSSCGGNSGGSDNTIYFWHTQGHDIENVIDKQATRFAALVKEHDGVDIKIELQNQGGYSDMVDKVNKSFSTGNTPTICVAYPDHVANYMANESKPGDYVVKLDDYMNDSEIGLTKQEYLNPGLKGADDFVESFMDEGQHYMNEGTYSLPYMKSTEIMLYNKDVVSRVLTDMKISTGVAEYMNNLTWSQFIDVLTYVKDNKAKYNLTEDEDAPLYYDSDSNLFIGQCFQRGIDFVSMKDGKGSMDFNNDKAKALVTEFKKYYDDGLMVTKGARNEYGSNWFKAAKCLFNVQSTGGTGYSDPSASFSVGTCTFPVYTGVSADKAKYVSQGVTLCLLNNKGLSKEVNDKKVKYGWEFLKYITNAQNNTDTCLASSGYIPARNSAYLTEDYKEYLAATDDFMSVTCKTILDKINGNYFNYPVFKGTETAREAVGGILKEVFLNKSNVDDAFKTAYETAYKAL